MGIKIMTKKIFKLWCEVHSLRKQKKKLEQKLAVTESCLLNAQKDKEEMYQLYLKAKQYKGESVFMFAVPQSNVFMRPYRMDSSFDPCTVAHYAERRVADMTDKMKIHLFDELLKKGFIKKYEPTPEETRYELRALRWYE